MLLYYNEENYLNDSLIMKFLLTSDDEIRTTVSTPLILKNNKSYNIIFANDEL